MTARLALPLLLFSVAALTACQERYALTNGWETWPTTPEPPQPLLGTVWKLHDLPATADKARPWCRRIRTWASSFSKPTAGTSPAMPAASR